MTTTQQPLSANVLREQLKKCIASCILRGTVKLASGQMSDFYINGKEVSLTSTGAQAIGELLFEKIRQHRITAIGGLTLGADPIIGSVLAVAGREGYPLKGLIVRKEVKDYGTGKRIEGPKLTTQDLICVVEDVVTTGGSAMKAIEAIRQESDARISLVVALVDRLSGGAERFAKESIPFEALFTRKDFDV